MWKRQILVTQPLNYVHIRNSVCYRRKTLKKEWGNKPLKYSNKTTKSSIVSNKFPSNKFLVINQVEKWKPRNYLVSLLPILSTKTKRLRKLLPSNLFAFPMKN